MIDLMKEWMNDQKTTKLKTNQLVNEQISE